MVVLIRGIKKCDLKFSNFALTKSKSTAREECLKSKSKKDSLNKQVDFKLKIIIIKLRQKRINHFRFG